MSSQCALTSDIVSIHNVFQLIVDNLGHLVHMSTKDALGGQDGLIQQDTSSVSLLCLLVHPLVIGHVLSVFHDTFRILDKRLILCKLYCQSLLVLVSLQWLSHHDIGPIVDFIPDESYPTVTQSIQGEVLALTHVVTWPELVSSLANENISSFHTLIVSLLDTEALRVGVLGLVGGTTRFFGGGTCLFIAAAAAVEQGRSLNVAIREQKILSRCRRSRKSFWRKNGRSNGGKNGATCWHGRCCE